MKSPILISLSDSDRFFLQGMQHLLKAFFYKKGISAEFVSTLEGTVADVRVADLIVKRAIAWEQHKHECHKIVIVRNCAQQGGGKIFALQGEVNRSEKLEGVVRLLDELFEPSAWLSHCDNATCIKISARERQVLLCIAAELTPCQIAKKLAISPKTVSGHKKTVMRKLGFSRQNDLYNWLLLHGITIGARITDATLTHAVTKSGKQLTPLHFTRVVLHSNWSLFIFIVPAPCLTQSEVFSELAEV
ncbi:response regulator transcription factor [Serratia fonticola]|uniref:helix-turn-helix transcriptional regulator n=1 Tax=Serratia fonticola TaxID=47917 RepID=UPI003BB5BF7D